MSDRAESAESAQEFGKVAAEMFLSFPRGTEILVYILRQFLNWQLPIADSDAAARYNAGVGIIRWLMGSDDTMADERFQDQLRALLLDKAGKVEAPSGKTGDWRDAATGTHRRKGN